MRNPELDQVLPIDRHIGELKIEQHGAPYRMIFGRAIMQIEEEDQKDKDINLIINRARVNRILSEQESDQ